MKQSTVFFSIENRSFYSLLANIENKMIQPKCFLKKLCKKWILLA